jgi:hypothetical protein
MCLPWGTNWAFISKKKTFFILTAVRTSNFRSPYILFSCWRLSKCFFRNVGEISCLPGETSRNIAFSHPLLEYHTNSGLWVIVRVKHSVEWLTDETQALVGNLPQRHCLPQSPHGVTRAGTWAAAVGSRQLTAWATARPEETFPVILYKGNRHRGINLRSWQDA